MSNRFRMPIGLPVLFVWVMAASLPAVRGKAGEFRDRVTVTTLEDSGPGSLRQAIAEVADGGTIDFGVTGTIVLTSGGLTVAKDLTINGPGTTQLTVSGNATTRVLLIPASVTVSVSGLTITAGKASDFGGGILNAGTLTLSAVTVTDNKAAGFGGGIANAAGALLTVTDSSISHNTAAVDVACSQVSCGSGGIANSGTLRLSHSSVDANTTGFAGGGIGNVIGATLTLTDCTVNDNRAGTDPACNDAADCGGGAIANVGTATIDSSTIARNHTNFAGGGVGNRAEAILTLTNTTLSDNAAGSDDASCDTRRCGGGGIASNAAVTVTASTIRNNTSTISGGGLASTCYEGSCGTLTVIRSTIAGNRTGTNPGCGSTRCGGGGIGNSATLTLTNSTISGNSANNSGGIGNTCFDGTCGTATLTNVTISGNSANFGGGIGNACIESQCAALTMKNSVVADHGAGGNCVAVAPSVIASGGYNLADDTSCNLTGPGDLANVVAQLGPLADNGGATPTHALLTGSPAIDAADGAACPATDQRGFLRPIDGNGDSQAVCDIGAYEFASAACTGDCGGDGEVTVDEIITMVNVALGSADVTACAAGDGNGDFEITIDEIITAVNAALSGCAK